MYSTFHHEIAKARVADFHEEIQRDVMGRAARKSRGGDWDPGRGTSGLVLRRAACSPF